MLYALLTIRPGQFHIEARRIQAGANPAAELFAVPLEKGNHGPCIAATVAELSTPSGWIQK